MKTDKKQLIQAIEAIKEKLASMEEELNKVEVYKHFPSKGDEYHFYTNTGILCSNIATKDDFKFNVFKTEKEAKEACNKAIAVEKIKRRLLELQGDWKPGWTDKNEEKFCIKYNYYESCFKHNCWYAIQHDSSIPYMKSSKIAETIIKEMEDELKLIFDIA